MAITTYAPREEFTGNGSTDTYSFAFKIAALSHLLVKKYDVGGVEVFSVRGTDTTDLDSVTFDAIEGGGQVVLAANLESNYKLVLLLAPDAPTQSSEFNNKQQLNLKFLERAFDFISIQVQRLAYLTSRSVKMNDSMTIAEMAAFDATLPDPADATAGGVLALTVDKDGFRYGVSLESVASDKAAAEAAALAAAGSQSAAASSASAASGSASAAGLSAAAALAAQQAAEAAQLAAETAFPIVEDDDQTGLSSGGQIDIGVQPFQTVIVSGAGGDINLNASPFSSTPSGPIQVTLVCSSNDGVRMVHADSAGGYVGENCLLKAYETLTVRYSPDLERWVKVSRSN